MKLVLPIIAGILLGCVAARAIQWLLILDEEQSAAYRQRTGQEAEHHR